VEDGKNLAPGGLLDEKSMVIIHDLLLVFRGKFM
jgi:hypothetical protein